MTANFSNVLFIDETRATNRTDQMFGVNVGWLMGVRVQAA